MFQVAKLPSDAEVEGLLLPPRPPSDAGKPNRKAGRTRAQQSNSVDNSSPPESIKSKINNLHDVKLKMCNLLA